MEYLFIRLLQFSWKNFYNFPLLTLKGSHGLLLSKFVIPLNLSPLVLRELFQL